MLKINRTLLCDQISQGLFGKINFEGYFPSNRIKLSNVPYILETRLVIEIEDYEKSIYEKKISIRLEVQSFEGHRLIEVQDFGLIPEINFETPLLVLPMRLQIPYYRVLKIAILIENELVFEDSYMVQSGESANFRLTETLISSSEMLNEATSNFSLVPFFSKALKEIVIVDLYLTPDFLLSEILPSVTEEVTVKVLTGENLKNKYIQDKLKIEAVLDKIEIRFSRDKTEKRGFHDRFIVSDWIEYFQFGHSLKDLQKGKISRRSKILSQEEIEYFKTMFHAEWNNAEPLQRVADNTIRT